MELSGLTVGRRSPSTLHALGEAARAAELTYGHVGSTLGDPPAGVRDAVFERDVPGTVASAAAALRGWAAHRGIRARVLPDGAPLEVGQTVLVVAPFGPLEMAVATRVVAVIDEPERFGFAYGTLPGHPEAGEELFVASATGAGRLRLRIRIHAVPATWLTRVGAPVTAAIQRAAARRYLDAWSAAITAHHPSAEEEGPDR